MCKSVQDGGQRCAAHTRPKLDAKSAAVEAAAKAGDLTALRAAQVEWEDAAAEYASTREGHAHLSAQAASADASGDLDTSSLLNTIVARGEALRAANRETAALLKAVRLSQTEPTQAPEPVPTSVPVSVPATSGVTTPAGTEPVDASAQGALMVADTSSRVVPDLSPEDRAAWASTLAALDDMAPSMMSVTGSSGYLYPEDIVEGLPFIDKTLSNPDASDDELAQAVSRIGMYSSVVVSTPHWKTTSMTGRDPQDKENNAKWTAFCKPFSHVMEAQAERALSHPNASDLTFEKAEESYLVRAEDLTARSNVPLGYLRATMKSAPTTVHANGWQKARDAVLCDNDNAMSFALAVNDPDTYQRNEAFNHVYSVPFETVSRDDRMYLAANLNKMPGSEENQRILADSLASWSRSWADPQERIQLAAILRMSNVLSVAEIGQGLSGTVSLQRTQPKTRKQWGF